MDKRFSDNRMNLVYTKYINLTQEQVDFICNNPSSNWDYEFKIGYKRIKKTPPIKNTVLYAVRIAGKEWEKNKIKQPYKNLIDILDLSNEPNIIPQIIDKTMLNHQEITFTQAAMILLETGGSIIFTAQNFKNVEELGFEFEITDFKQLCEEYKLLYQDYYNIKLWVPNEHYS